MKNINLIAAAAVVIFMTTSCIQDQFDNHIPQPENSVEFTASNISTKTSLVNGRDVYWNPGDQISVFGMSRTGVNFTTKNLEQPSATTTFVGQEEPFYGGNYYAIYPAKAVDKWTSPQNVSLILPMVQDAENGTFSNGLNISYAQTTVNEMSFSFHNLLSYIHIKLEASNVNSIKLLSLGQKTPIAGIFTFDFVKKQIAGFKFPQYNVEMTVTEPGDYYIAVLPGTYKNGINIICLREGMGPLVKSLSGERVVESGKIYNVGTIKN